MKLDQQYSVRYFMNYNLPLALIKSNLNWNANVGYSQTLGLMFGELNYSCAPAAGLGVVLSSNSSPELDFTISCMSLSIRQQGLKLPFPRFSPTL